MMESENTMTNKVYIDSNTNKVYVLLLFTSDYSEIVHSLIKRYM